MLSAERLFRYEKYLDVPDRDGSKPFVFSIDGKDLQASNRKKADWQWILTRTKTYVSKGDLTQQFAAFKRVTGRSVLPYAAIVLRTNRL